MKAIRKYVAFARIAAIHAASERGDLYGRIAFLGIVLGVFSALWRAVAEAGMPMAAEPDALVWYLAATEWILMSPASAHIEIEGEIRRGEVAAQLARPYSSVTAMFARGLGALAVRAPAIGIAALAWALLFTGQVPDVRALFYLVPFGLVAMVIVHGMQVLIGLTAFWLGDVSPLFWVWQKLLFVLGGLMLPLSLYPPWLQRLSDITPFPWVLSRPASFLIAGSTSEAFPLAVGLIVWATVVPTMAWAMFFRATRSLQMDGG
jgi:ABC-2 type transport system permease protein